jgi:hypothetical protein
VPVFEKDGKPKLELNSKNEPIPRRKKDGTILRDSNGDIMYKQVH